MSATYGAQTAQTSGANLSFSNISTGSVSFMAGGITYTLAVGQNVSIPQAAATSSTSLEALLASGAIRQLTVYGSSSPTAAIVPTSSSSVSAAPVSFTAATQSSITGSFNGIGIDPTTSYWILSNGNRLIYPNAQSRSQPNPGLNSTVTIGATMQREGLVGTLGFALYTDAGPTAQTFSNGLQVAFESSGLCQIYRFQNNLVNNLVDPTTQVGFPVDLSQHTYAAVVQQPTSSQFNVYAYVDGLVVAQASITQGIISNGTIGFSTAAGCSPVLIVPSSFVFTLGTDTHETSSVATQQIISSSGGTATLNIPGSGSVTGQLPVAANSPEVLAGSVTGTPYNIVTDSSFAFGSNLWNTVYAGSMSVQLGVGAAGGKGIVFANTTNLPVNTGTLQFISSPLLVTPGSQWTLSGNILATDTVSGGTGLPAWEVWTWSTQGLVTMLASAPQDLGQPLTPSDVNRRNQDTFFIPTGITEVVCVASTNNVAVSGRGSIVWSEPMLQAGPYETAYVANIIGDQGTTMPLVTSPVEITSVIVANGSGGGAVLLGQAAPNSYAPYLVMPSQITSVVSENQGVSTTYLQNQTVANSSVVPGAISQTSASQVTYTNNQIANIFDNILGNYYWYLVGSGPITVANTILDGSTIVYSVSTADPSASPAPLPDPLIMDANSTITVVWNHPAFIGTSIGSTIVSFTGDSANSTAAIPSVASLSDVSTPTITSTQQTQTTTPSSTAAITNTGNPSITSNTLTQTTATPATAAIMDSSSPQISYSANSYTQAVPVSAAATTVISAPKITETILMSTNIVASSAAVNWTSTPGVTGVTSLVPTPMLENATSLLFSQSVAVNTVSGSYATYTPTTAPSQTYTASPSITSSTSTNVETVSATSTSNYNDYCGITTTANTSTSIASQSAATNGGSTSIAYISQTGTTGSKTTATGNLTLDEPTCTCTKTTAVGPHGDPVVVYTDSGGGQGPTSTFTLQTSYPTSGSFPVTLNLSLAYYGDTDLESTTVTLVVSDGGNNTLVNTTINSTTYSQTFTSGTAGAWKCQLYATSVSDGASHKTAGSTTPYVDVSYTFSGFLSEATYGTTTGNNVALASVDVTAAPTSGSQAVSYACGSITPVSNANGVAYPNLFLYGPSTLVYGPLQPAAGQTYSYSAAGAPVGTYTWYYHSVITTNNNNGANSYATNMTGTMGWYDTVQTTTYSSSTYNGQTASQQTSGQTVSPSAANPITITISNLSCPSDSNGMSELAVALIGPDNNTYLNQNITSSQTLSYASGGPSGIWTVRYTAVTNGYNGQPTTSSRYNVTGTITVDWWQSESVSSVTYFPGQGTQNYFTSGPNTAAPTTAATAVTWTATNVICVPDSYGTPYIQLSLTDFNGDSVPIAELQYSTNNGASWQNASGQYYMSVTQNMIVRYYSANAIGGEYFWNTSSTIIPNNNGTSTYPISATIVIGYSVYTSGTNYTSTGTKSPPTSIYTSTITLAPTATSLAIACNLTNIALPSDPNGSTSLVANLYSSAGTLLTSQTLATSQSQQPGILSYYSVVAASGSYQFAVFAQATPSASATGNSIYPVSCTIGCSYYEMHPAQVVTYSAYPGFSQSFVTDAGTLAPSSSATALTLNLQSVTVYADSYGASTFSVTLNSPDDSFAASWQNISSPQLLTYYNSGANQTGIYSWVIYAYCTSTGTGMSKYPDTLTGTLGWYENQTTSKVKFNDIAGAANTYTTGASGLAPTSAATELTFNIGTLVAVSDVNGSSSWNVALSDSSGTTVKTWAGLVTPQTLPYSSTSAIAGSYKWTVQAVCTDTATASATYNDTLTASLGWYENQTISDPGYTITPGNVHTIATTAALAPTTAATQISLVPTTVSTPHDATATSEYVVSLQDPSGNIVANWIIMHNLTTPLTYSASAAVSGIYTFTYYATVVLGTSPTSETIPTTLDATVGWFINQAVSSVQYVNNPAPQISSASTSTQTLAPTLPGLALQLQIGTLVLPQTAAGATQYIVILRDPNGSPVLNETITSSAPIIYYNSAAIGGSYTWSVYGVCTNTGTATYTFETQISGTLIWYTSVSQTIIQYTNNDGTPPATYRTPANTVAPINSANELSLSLQTVNTAPKSYGTCSLAVFLTDPNGDAVLAAARSDITEPVTITYAASAAISGIYTWSVYGQCQNNGTGTGSFTTAWSGQYSWFEPAASNRAVYILAADGITQRQSISDADIDFISITPSQATFNITNSASVPLGFSLGILSKGF